MPEITWVRNDQNFYQEFDIADYLGETVDITGCSIGLKLQRYGSGNLVVNKQCEVLDGTLGLCRVFIEDEIKSLSGEFAAELEIRWPSGKILTAPDIFVKILKDLPR